MEMIEYFLSSIALLLSVYAIYRTGVLSGTSIEFQSNQRRRLEQFETQLEEKMLQYELSQQHFPHLISDFNKGMKMFRRQYTQHELDVTTFEELTKRIESGEIEVVHRINSDLYAELRTIQDDLIPKFAHYETMKMTRFTRILDRWTEHLLTYDHGHFSERAFADRVLIQAFNGLLNDNPDRVNINFRSELDTQLAGSSIFQDNYIDETPNILKQIAQEELVDLIRLKDEIFADFEDLEITIESMLEIMRTPLSRD